jgi:hypothetical protein
LKQYTWVNDNAISNYWNDVWAEDSGWQQVQCIFLITDNNCVARIVSTLIADNIINAVAKNVSGFAFTFIAPLGTEEY